MRLQQPARDSGKKVVVIIGGGFGGLNAAKRLANKPGVQVILVDQRNHHLFQPLLYQVATAGLNAADIAVPIRAQFKDATNVETHLGRVERVDLAAGLVCGGGHELPYDYLILACGAHQSYFGREEWSSCAPGLKTLEQALEIRRRILMAFERAENELDTDRQRALLTFVVVGGGPTGVELAGAIADISRTVLRNDFRRIDPATAHVILVEGGSRILPSFAETLSARAAQDLRELGVDVRTGTVVQDIDADGVTIGADRVQAASVFWAAGIAAARLDTTPSLQVDRVGRVRVNRDFSIPGHPSVFAVGDMASFSLDSGETLPAVAPAAIQGGRHAAEMILRDMAGRSRRPFTYVDKGQMATIGKSRAVAQSGRLAMTGRLAWLAWLFVHVLYLVGVRNRVAVICQWGWNYLFSRRESRIITERA